MKILKQTVLPLTILIVYLTVCKLDLVNPYLIPRPRQIGEALLALLKEGTLQHHIFMSLKRVFYGFLLTLSIALPLATFFSLAPRVARFFLGTLHFLRCTPPLALVPLLILWFGIGEASKLALIVLASFFPVFLNTLSGLRQVDPELLEMGDTLELNRKEKILNILIPEALPTILTGMRLAFGYSWRALIGAEMIAAASGLGYMILDAQEMARTDKVFIGILTIGLLGLFIDSISVRFMEKRFPWLKEERI